MGEAMVTKKKKVSQQSVGRAARKSIVEQNKLVVFRVTPDVIGVGKICGLSTIDMPVIGRGVIVEIVSCKGIDKSVYPYSHMVVFEHMIEEVYEEKREDCV